MGIVAQVVMRATDCGVFESEVYPALSKQRFFIFSDLSMGRRMFRPRQVLPVPDEFALHSR
jgi:hypothetical protein